MAAEADPWRDAPSRYEHDAGARFLLVVEQLVEASALVRSGDVPKLRMALVTVDGLVEVILHRRKERVLEVADVGWREAVPRPTASELKRFSGEFGARLALARTAPEDGYFADSLKPLLDDLDESIVRTGHAYRNRLYHADHHNAAVLPLITRAYLGAVGRAFVRLQPEGVAWSMGDARLSRLEQLGYRAGEDDVFGGRMLVPHDAAAAIVASATTDLELGFAETRGALQSDLEWRTAWAGDVLGELAADMPVDRLAWALRWGEFWSAHRTDDQVVEYTRAMSESWQARLHGADREECARREAEASAARNARISELLRDFTPSFDPGAIPRIRRLGARLANAKNLGTLFARYRDLDAQMEAVERTLHDLAVGWERHVQAEIDRSRGR